MGTESLVPPAGLPGSPVLDRQEDAPAARERVVWADTDELLQTPRAKPPPPRDVPKSRSGSHSAPCATLCRCILEAATWRLSVRPGPQTGFVWPARCFLKYLK